MNFIKQLAKPVVVATTLFLMSLFYYGYAALNFPTLFNIDNVENFAATKYIVEHKKIPVVTADDTEILFSNIGTTRSLRPPFTFIVSAIAANLTATITNDPVMELRLGSPIIAAASVVVFFIGFYLAFNHLGLALAGTISIALLPKFVFLASSNNDDIGAILSVSMMFASVIALTKYRYKTGFLLAIAFSLGLIFLSKYTAWLTLPWFGLFCLTLFKSQGSKILKLMPVLLLVTFVSGGWWLGFNMLNYGISDPSAMEYAAQLQGELSDIEPNRQGYASIGIGLQDLLSNHDNFLANTYKSAIGYLQWLELEIGKSTYLFYAAIFLIALISVAFRSRASHGETAYLDFLALALIIGQCAFYLHHNLLRDIQPQARYILPVIMPMMYLFLRAVEQVPSSAVIVKIKNKSFEFQAVTSLAIISLCGILHHNAFENHIKPSFIAKPFYTNINRFREIHFQDDIEIAGSKSLTYRFVDAGVELVKSNLGTPTLELTPAFCDLLPLNAIITINVNSQVQGGLYLRLDRDNLGTYNNINWRNFPAGESIVIFSVNSQNCTGAQITLADNTFRITLNDFRIRELRIHEHGRPVL